MTFPALAKALRRRLLRARLHDKATLHAQSDESIVSAYTVCAQCQGPLFATRESERMAVALAESPEHFVALVNTALAAHRCAAAGAPRN